MMQNFTSNSSIKCVSLHCKRVQLRVSYLQIVGLSVVFCADPYKLRFYIFTIAHSNDSACGTLHLYLQSLFLKCDERTSILSKFSSFVTSRVMGLVNTGVSFANMQNSVLNANTQYGA